MKKDEKVDKQVELKVTAGVAMYPSLKVKLEKEAEKDGRSFSDFCCRILAQHV